MQRAPAGDEAREHLLEGYQREEQETLQRTPADEPPAAGGEAAAQPAGADEQADADRILMQLKPAGAAAAPAEPSLESGVRALQGGGRALSPSVRGTMEGRFGHDFGDVRVHTDAAAGELARRANARAFTVGQNLVFAPGEYAPERSAEGRHLLAHELAHVVQQRRAAPALRRKIVVGGLQYTPSASYYAFIDKNFGVAMHEFVERMHNSGNPPEYKFASYEQLGNEIRVRAKAIKGIEAVHAGCCDYFDTAHPAHLDPTFWDPIPGGAPWDFQLKSPLPAGKQPSDAINSIFAPGAGTRLECFSMTVAIEYYSMLKGLGAAAFNARFASGIRIAGPSNQTLSAGAGAQFVWTSAASKTDLLPGDWVYFKNFADYTARVPDGYWQGENAIYLGGGKYRGFGVGELSEDDLNKELVKQYNDGGHVVPPKGVPDLLAQGGGLWLSPVLRPISSKLPSK